MKILLFRSFFGVALLAAMLFSPTPADAQNGAKIAGLEQDISDMRDQIPKLRTEVQDLRVALATEKSKNNNTGASDRALQQQLAADRAANAEALRALESRMNLRIKALGDAFNKALAAQPVAPPPPPPSKPPQTPGLKQPPPVPADTPHNAVKYVIKSGDSLEKIARAHKSKVAWILGVNDTLNPTKLKIGTEILVPCNAEPDAKTPSPAP
jgi:LysM repeat protein